MEIYDKCGKLTSWKCNQCRQTDIACLNVSSMEANINSETVIISEFNLKCQCFDHIKILTDQIYDLTKNQADMSNQLCLLQEDNIRLNLALANQSETIGDIISNNNRHSYSSILKSNLKENNGNTSINSVENLGQNRNMPMSNSFCDSAKLKLTNSVVVVYDTQQQPQVVIRPTLSILSSQTVPIDRSVSPIVNPSNIGVNHPKKQFRGFKTHHNPKSEK